MSTLAIFLVFSVAAGSLPAMQTTDFRLKAGNWKERNSPSVISNPKSEIRNPKSEVEAGRLVYEKWCQYCHGAEGDGKTPAAENMLPRPRDFTFGLYKYRTTFSGEMPTDDDLIRIVRKGMPGSTMPAWEGILSEQEIQDVVAYIKSFAAAWFEGAPAESQISVGTAPEVTPELLERGRALYEGEVECFKCHGMAGRGDGPSVPELEDDWGHFIRARNLTRNWTFRGGGTVEDIFLTITTGRDGTPMPSQLDALPDEADRWALAHYVRSLSPPHKPEVKPVLEAVRVRQGKLPASVHDPGWEQIAPSYFPLVGQIMTPPRNFNPMVTEVWVKALYSDEAIALLITWDDPSASLRAEAHQAEGSGQAPSHTTEPVVARSGDRPQQGEEGAVDAVAVQFPVEIPAGMEKPYFLMGDRHQPVNLWYWQAAPPSPQTGAEPDSPQDWGGGGAEERNAQGMDRVETQPAESQNITGEIVYQDGQYRMMVRRPRFTEDSEHDVQFEEGRFIPIAFAAWDGFSGEVGKKGAVSAWYFLFLRPATSATRFLWVPLALVITAAVEGLLVWNVKRSTQ